MMPVDIIQALRMLSAYAVSEGTLGFLGRRPASVWISNLANRSIAASALLVSGQAQTEPRSLPTTSLRRFIKFWAASLAMVNVV
jgi:hypothetical protein